MGSKLLQELKKQNTNDSADVPFLIDFLYSFFFQKKLVFPSKTMADGDTSCLREVLGPGSCQMYSLHWMLTNRSEAKSEDLIPIKDRVITGIQRISLALSWKIKA